MLKISYLKTLLKTNSFKTLNLPQMIYNTPRMTVVSKETVLKSKF